MLSPSIDQVLATLGVALAYLLLVRLADVNEREPLWTVLLAFVVGGAAAGALFLGVSHVTLNFGTWPGAALRELALCVALLILFRGFAEIGRLQGWPLVSDVLDGLIYGAAAGLGFSCGEAIALLDTEPSLMLPSTSLVDMASRAALNGLAQGVFGAILGAGLGMTADRARPMRWISPVVALALAIAAHGGHEVLAHGNALAGDAALWRSRLALALPVVAIAGIAIFELIAERRKIAQQLADDTSSGDATPDELALLTNVARRQMHYLRLLLHARWSALRAAAALHNQQVMLALAKHRASHGDADTRAATAREIAALRQAIRDRRTRIGSAPEVS